MWNSTRHPRGDKLCIYLQTIHVYPTMHYGYVLYGFQICSLWTNKSLLKTLPGATGFDIAKAILTEGLVDGFQMEQPYIQVMCSLQVVFHYTDVSGISRVLSKSKISLNVGRFLGFMFQQSFMMLYILGGHSSGVCIRLPSSIKSITSSAGYGERQIDVVFNIISSQISHHKSIS